MSIIIIMNEMVKFAGGIYMQCINIIIIIIL